ncbi:MAG: restriction endonuclease subunit S [Blastocatellia bacterium]|nr:restriction endonuclease subunit S [Blastocatellia bacterium]
MARDFRETGVPLIRLAGLKAASSILSGCNYLDPEMVDTKWSKFRLKLGDVLLSTSASLGEVATVGPEGVGAVPYTGIIGFRPRDSRIDARFIPLMLTCPEFKNQIQAMGVGSVMNHFGPSHLRRMTVSFPRLGKQAAIAEVLGALDDKIAANNRAAQLSRELSVALFRRAAADGDLRSINELAELVSRGVSPKYSEDGLTVLNQKCIRDQSVSLAPARTMTPLRSRLDRILRKHDVLVNSTGQGTLGRVARWTHDCEATVDSHITIVRFDPAEVDAVCAGFAVLGLESQIESLAEGSTGQTELRRDLLSSLEVRIPTRAAQADLGLTLAQFDSMELALAAENAQLAKTHDELLPLLMSGKLRVKDAEQIVEEIV